MAKGTIHNLTDVSTPMLVASGLVNMTLAVGDKLVAPGESVEVDNPQLCLKEHPHLFARGALFFGKLPNEYAAKHAELVASKSATLAEVPVSSAPGTVKNALKKMDVKKTESSEG